MKSKKLYIIVFCFVFIPSLITGLLIVLNLTSGTTYSRTEQYSDTEWVLEYQDLKTECRHTMDLELDDVMMVLVNNEKGDLSIIVKDENGKIAYQGKGLKNEAFSFVIPKTGKYEITVIGKKALGKTSFKVDREKS